LSRSPMVGAQLVVVTPFARLSLIVKPHTHSDVSQQRAPSTTRLGEVQKYHYVQRVCVKATAWVCVVFMAQRRRTRPIIVFKIKM